MFKFAILSECGRVVELLKMLKGEGRRIPLATTAGTPIENEVQPQPSHQHKSFFAVQVEKFSDWVVRKEATGIYNCFGHVWASRRTAILDDREVEKIRIEDRYRVADEPKVGDLAIYFHFHDNRRCYDHVAEIVEIREIAGSGKPVPWVLSKLGSGGGEVIHNFTRFPGYADYEVEYWTDRS